MTQVHSLELTTRHGDFPAVDERPGLSVDVVICSIREGALQVLLARRAVAPFRGRWMIPGNFLRAHETLDEAARRALQAQTEAHDAYLEQLYAFDAPRRDPHGRVVTVAYLALVGPQVQARAETSATGTAWHPITALPDLAFDHGDILRYARQRLRFRLEYTAPAFELLPNEFTLSELQAAYELVLGEALDKRNFRRRILEAGFLTETARYRASEGQGRPARLYRYRKSAATPLKARRLFP